MGAWPEAEGHTVVTTPCALHSGKDLGAMEPDEDYQSPFDFAAGVNKEYLYLSPSGNPSPPGSPVLQKVGNYEFSQVLFAVRQPGSHVGLAWL